VPSSTDEEIDELCRQIRALCSAPFSEESEEQLRHLAKKLALAIERHVRMAKDSLTAKQKAIWTLDKTTEQ
jgi:hypothetical protein